MKTVVLVVSLVVVSCASWYASPGANLTRAHAAERPSSRALSTPAALTGAGSRAVPQAQNGAGAPAPGVKYIAHAAPGKWYRQLSELVGDSSEIVIGIPILEKAYHPRAVKSMVFTYYQVQILDSLKGNLRKGTRLSLSVPGGQAVSEDGTSVEVAMPDDWNNPAVGQAYVFFLKRTHGPYQLVGGPQGLFAISPWPENFSMKKLSDVVTGKTVIPQVNAAHKFTRVHKNQSVASFLQQIRQIEGRP